MFNRVSHEKVLKAGRAGKEKERGRREQKEKPITFLVIG
jgi:hypothetical protein